VIRHPVSFTPSGRTALVADGGTILEAAEAAGEPIAAECAGRGACGRCLVGILSGQVPAYCVERRDAGTPLVLACQTPVHGPITVQPLAEADLPHLVSREQHLGLAPVNAFAPWPLALDPIVAAETEAWPSTWAPRRCSCFWCASAPA